MEYEILDELVTGIAIAILMKKFKPKAIHNIASLIMNRIQSPSSGVGNLRHAAQ